MSEADRATVTITNPVSWRAVLGIVASAALLAIITSIAINWAWSTHTFLHLTGSNNEAGPWYGFWSGFGGSFLAPNMAVFTVGFGLLRVHNCHVKGCWRVARHPDASGHYKVCGHCFNRLEGRHPNHRFTFEHIHEAHHAAKARLSGTTSVTVVTAFRTTPGGEAAPVS